jgi:UDP-3-O-[3-hydroxymyristoyl] glucosamine N-acyltransferase
VVVLGALARSLQGEFYGDPSLEITGPASLEAAQPGQVSFCLNASRLKNAKKTKASAVITYEYCDFIENQVVVSNPKKGLADTINFFFPKHDFVTHVSEKSDVHSSVVLPEKVHVGSFSVISEDVSLGSGCYIGSHVVIGRGCHLDVGCNHHPIDTPSQSQHDSQYNNQILNLHLH